MLKGLWSRLTGRPARGDEVGRERMTPAERSHAGERFEDRQADLAIEARLGGIDPERLLPDDDPRGR